MPEYDEDGVPYIDDFEMILEEHEALLVALREEHGQVIKLMMEDNSDLAHQNNCPVCQLIKKCGGVQKNEQR